MAKLIFINLPVSVLARATAFYEAIGAARNPQFSDATASCMVSIRTPVMGLATVPAGSLAERQAFLLSRLTEAASSMVTCKRPLRIRDFYYRSRRISSISLTSTTCILRMTGLA